MIAAQPMIAVHDVRASCRWYRALLGCRSTHGGDEYEQLVDTAGKLILQLHHWDAHEHPHLGNPAQKPYGNGVMLWFEVSDFDGAFAHHRELWVADPDGYTVVLASPAPSG
jgi:catechol 2,3-dioxygenase-like lactoylglutathione lyase family enzyme